MIRVQGALVKGRSPEFSLWERLVPGVAVSLRGSLGAQPPGQHAEQADADLRVALNQAEKGGAVDAQ